MENRFEKICQNRTTLVMQAFLNEIGSRYGITCFEVLERSGYPLFPPVENWTIVACWEEGFVRMVDGSGKITEESLIRLCEVLKRQHDQSALLRY